MDSVIFETNLVLLPGGVDPQQTSTYCFLDLPLPSEGRFVLTIAFESSGMVQLPLALYGPDRTVRLTRASEPARGKVALDYPFEGLPAECGPPDQPWKLILHKRILGERLAVRVYVGSDPIFGSDVIHPGAEHTGSDPSIVLMGSDPTEFCVELSNGPAISFDRAVPEQGPGWYSGELHLHSDMSTGRTDVATIVRVARERGLDFLGLTDHFTPSHWERIEELQTAGSRPLFLRSVEIAGDRGHANLHGVRAWPDPFPDAVERQPGPSVPLASASPGFSTRLEAFLGKSVASSMEAAADIVHAQGGLFCINHPLSAGVAWRYREFPLEKADLFEVASLPDGPVSFLYPTLWDRLLCDGLKPTGVGSSDSHDPLQDGPWALGRIRNWVFAQSLSREGILAGLAAHNSYVALGEARLSFRAFDPASGREYPMGSTVLLSAGDECEFEATLSGHPSGNLFIMRDGFLHDVRHCAGSREDVVRFRIPAYDIGTGRNASGRRLASYVRLEYHEDLEKARYHGMAFRDHRSLRLLSNPIWMEVCS
jgi:hypothetical protein